MSKNRILSESAIRDIDQRVERVLKGLGHPEPPLNLEDVRYLLNLDVRYYTSSDPGIVQEAISRIRVATVQVFQRPTLLVEAIKKFSLKALYLPDRKRILLDSSLPEKKHRWNEAHEVGHSLLPWHGPIMHGDNSHTLTPDCHAQAEAEANFAAGRLLFLRDRFTEEARSLTPCISSVRQLHQRFGNTISTTMYRFIELSDAPMVGMITGHPHVARRPSNFDPAHPCRYCIQSRLFAERFGRTSEVELFRAMASYCGQQRGGTLGSADLILSDNNGDGHRFHFETFFNRYDALTIGVYLRPERHMIAA